MDYSAKNVRQVLKAIDTSYKKFYKKQGGLPKFKAKWNDVPSFPLADKGTFKMRGKFMHIHQADQTTSERLRI